MKLLTQLLTTVALGLALAPQATPSHIDVPESLWHLSQWVVVGLVGVVFWFVRQTYADHDRRLNAMERHLEEDLKVLRRDREVIHERMEESTKRLQIAVARLEAVCPFVNPQSPHTHAKE
jgi:hypothetical protein